MCREAIPTILEEPFHFGLVWNYYASCVSTVTCFYIEIFMLQILCAGHKKYGQLGEHDLYTSVSYVFSETLKIWNSIHFGVMVLILDRSSREEHEFCISDKRNTNRMNLDVLEAIFTFHYSEAQI